MQSTLMHEHEMMQALREGALLVTVNNRLARHWRGLFAQQAAEQSMEKASVWSAPNILPWGAWLRQLWDAASWLAPDAPLLLDARQADVLWRKIIERESAALLQAAASARLAQEAWQTVQDACVTLPFDALECNEDVLRFQAWAQEFTAECARHGWLDEARLPQQVTEALTTGQIAPPARVLLLGFEEWRPRQQALLQALRSCGTDVVLVEPQSDGVVAGRGGVRVALADAAGEDEAAARWVRARLQADPAARLAIIAPDLRTRRARLARLLDAQLAPQRLLPSGQDVPRAWNMSLGAALREHGMVQAALLVFALGDERLDLARLGQALRSPFLAGGAGEREARAMLDARLRTGGELAISNVYVRAQAEEQACPRFARSLEQLAEARHAQVSRQSPVAWAEALREELRLAGWPGDGALSSEDFQLRQAWLDTLQSLGRLELVQARMSRSEALAHLRALAAETPFQPEAVTDAPVQVLGPLEALGLHFDGVWLLGMHHEQWPQQVRPSPFLPMRLQVRLEMPHASPARELAYARRISARLLDLAAEVIVSHAQQEEGRELEPSPLFVGLAEVALTDIPQADIPLPSAWSLEGAVVEKMAFVQDADAPSLIAGTQVKGGARVLQLQSDCPFRACAELRLGAQALETPDLGPDARLRGEALHAVMERVWGELGTQAALLALDEAACKALVERHARAAMDELAHKRRSLWPVRLQDLEVARLSELVSAWLVLERERPPFVVEARESTQLIEIGGLQLKVKIDRIDRLSGGVNDAAGCRLILDYKTGAAKPADWAGERPAAPQLPLYAVSTAQTCALAFAQVRAGDMAFSGLQDAQGADAGLNAVEGEWDAVLADYWHVLETLAENFRLGHAEVDPRQPSICTHCDLGLLCRIHERAGEGFALNADAYNCLPAGSQDVY